MPSLVESFTLRYRGTCLVLLGLALAACATPPSSGRDVDESLLVDGFEAVSARRFDSVQLRPGVDFSRYHSVMLAEPVLEYRAPDRALREVPLDETRKAEFADFLKGLFRDELETMSSLELVSDKGPGVLEMAVGLTDITATVPPRSAGPAGRVSIALRAVGDVTLVMDFSDSESGELLTRVVDHKAVDGVAIAMDGELVTRWEDVEAICERWARLTRQGIETALRPR